MTISVRRAEESDFETVLSLERELAVFEGKPNKVKNTVDLMRAEKDHFVCFLAEADGEAVGMIVCFFSYYISVGKCLFINALYVRDVCRGKGVGRQLLDAARDFARTAGCKKMSLQVEKWNTGAQRVYEKYGGEFDDGWIDCDFEI